MKNISEIIFQVLPLPALASTFGERDGTIDTSQIRIESQNERQITLGVGKLKQGVYLFSYQNSLNEIIHLRFIKN
ncbi:hypothetical protein [Algoriphagus boritolerans]|uniref:Uncharacterized protein n=1 Tax=Algoriphagus boritolerans DSM 17298 = JCM 18970 TaxID=1120964 RepID=A0A1H5ZJW9_9BACT|nr:hypothetical protein [Algoriphagus boritolerans]SEG36542.1 hypothetical protein SAMN03080598_03554 [Algoriphagus boritolerans DSM 17298 = JCM 18970]